MIPFYRYYVRTLPNGCPIQCPSNRGRLVELYFTTIYKLTGIDQPAAVKLFSEGRVIRTAECEFWARDIMDRVIPFYRKGDS
jgi:hypothetical protein